LGIVQVLPEFGEKRRVLSRARKNEKLFIPYYLYHTKSEATNGNILSCDKVPPKCYGQKEHHGIQVRDERKKFKGVQLHKGIEHKGQAKESSGWYPRERDFAGKQLLLLPGEYGRVIKEGTQKEQYQGRISRKDIKEEYQGRKSRKDIKEGHQGRISRKITKEGYQGRTSRKE
jgi:hypothetical protein